MKVNLEITPDRDELKLDKGRKMIMKMMKYI